VISFDPEVVAKWVCKTNGATYAPGQFSCIGRLNEAGNVLGGVLYEAFTPGGSVTMHVAGTPNWLTRKFLWYIFDYPFNQLKVNKLLGFTPSDNLAAHRFHRHIGFQQEARITGAGRHGSDLIIYSMTRDQCRWLSLRKPENEQLQHPIDP